MKADRELTEAERKSHHLLLVGRSACSDLIEEMARSTGVRFTTQTFSVGGAVYGDDCSAVCAAGPNVMDPAYSVVVVAGLSPLATFKAAGAMAGWPATNVRIAPARGKARDLVGLDENLTREIEVN